jgi:hypothetical protein
LGSAIHKFWLSTVRTEVHGERPSKIAIKATTPTPGKMEIVTCHCLKCKAKLGRFRNSWNGIGNTYFSPVHPPLSVVGFESTGDVYEAAQGSQIEDR